MTRAGGPLEEPPLRAFVALTLPESAVGQLAKAQRYLNETTGLCRTGLRLVENEQFHVTLAFLGDVMPAQTQPIIDATLQVASQHSCCWLNPRELTAFPSTRHARAIAIALEDTTRSLDKLVSALHSRLCACGCTLENREFSAHVTLARPRKAERISLPDLDACRIVGPILCTTITVLRSELRTSGARYHTLASAQLARI